MTLARHRRRHPRPGLPWRHRLAHSLRWRLVGVFLLLAFGVTMVFVGGTRQAFSNGWRELVRPLLSDYVDRLAAEVGNPPDLARAQALTQRLPVAIHIQGPRLNWSSDPAPDGAEARQRGPRDPAWRALLTRRSADGHEIRFALAAGRADEHPRWWQWWHWWPLAGLLVLTALAFAYVRRLFKPVDDIRAGVQRYGTGDFAQPIPVRRRDELGELATQVNGMAANLSGLFEGQRALLLAISHELRSPLTRARLNAELVAEGPERDALLRDLAQMRDLVTDLLESERLAAGRAVLQREPCDLLALLRGQVALQLGERAEQAVDGRRPRLRIEVDPALPPTLLLDPSRLQLLLRNLLANALQHGQPVDEAAADAAGADIVLRLQIEPADGALRLVLRDHGPGVPPGQLEKLAQPFARPDAARSRAHGGVGLGLYLCRLVAQSHGGSLRLHNARPGLQVTVTLPLDAQPAA